MYLFIMKCPAQKHVTSSLLNIHKNNRLLLSILPYILTSLERDRRKERKTKEEQDGARIQLRLKLG